MTQQSAVSPEETSPDRPDVFISYAREDQDFVRRLHDALVARGRQSWVDWEGIPPTAEWMAEVKGAIEAANSFIFVVSPSSVGSRVCREEADHAASQGKRLVPIVRTDVDGDQVPEPVAARNWIFFRDRDDFVAATETLVEALDTDLQWVRSHTRLLVRAKEWDQGGRDRASILRGKDLDAAERWLAEAGLHAEPHPTSLHTEYVIASRRAAARGQRARLVAVAVALVVSLGLSAFAFVQRNEAVRQRQRAEQEARIRQSRELATTSRDLLDVDPELSVLLAAEAATIQPTPQAEIALRQALAGSQIRLALGGGIHRVDAAAFSPEGDRVITAGEDGTARIWDVSAGRPLAVLSGHDAPVTDAVFSPAGNSVLTAGADGTVRVWDAADGGNLAILRGSVPDSLQAVEPVRRIAVSPDGSRVVVCGVGPAQIWDAATGETLTHLGESFVTVNDAMFSPDGGSVITGSDDDMVRIWDSTTGRRLSTLRAHRDEVTGVAFSSDGERVVTSSDDGTARIWDVDSEKSVSVLRGHHRSVTDVAFGADSRLVLTGSGDGTARLWDADAGAAVTTILTQHSVAAAALNPDGTRVLTTGDDGTARIWQTEPGATLATLEGHEGTVNGSAFNPDGAQVVTAGEDGTARIWEAETGDALSILQGHEGPVNDAAFSPDGDRVVTAGKDGSARTWDAATGDPLEVLDGHQGPVLSASFSPSGAEVLTTAADGVTRIWDAATGALIDGTGTGTGTVSGAVFDPSGERVAIFGTSVFLWDRSTEEYTELGPTATTLSAAFGPDGYRLITAGQDGNARLWDVMTTDALVTLRGHRGPLTDAAFSPDGTQVVTAGTDRTMRIWNARTGEQFLLLPTGGGPVQSAEFDHSGSSVLMAGEDGVAVLWACLECAPLPELLDLARDRVTRDLTPEERVRYLG